MATQDTHRRRWRGALQKRKVEGRPPCPPFSCALTGIALRSEVGTVAAMETPVAPSFLPLIQLAITPVILLSGVGALMLTLTNRMARIVDRTRSLAGQVQSAAGEERPHLVTQLEILWHRAGLIRLAVTLAGRIVRRELRTDDHTALITEALEQFPSSN